METITTKKTKPDWLRVKLPTGENYKKVRNIVEENKLHTICQSGNCPNMGECWGAGTATFMILGNICTRSCQFCNVATGKPEAVDEFEPLKVAKSIKLMNLKHCVITSVDRDDLKDGGANIWYRTINTVRKINPQTTIETLIPDFKGETHLLDLIIKAHPEIISHNIETVQRLTKKVRVQAKYERSLSVLKYLSLNNMKVKSGLMLGLGETMEEIYQTLRDLIENGVKILTIGQYLQPTKAHLEVQEFIHPDIFLQLKKESLQMGFEYVESGPLVRSSYHAEKHI